jgi:ATP-dependent RNA helicase DDX51/DBP6
MSSKRHIEPDTTVPQESAEPDESTQLNAELDEDTVNPLPPLLPPMIAKHEGSRSVSASVLPPWFLNPIYVDPHVSNTSALPDYLSAKLIAALRKNGVSSLFPIQNTVIPQIIASFDSSLHPGDFCVCAPTGSGKTLSYVLPILHCLRTRLVRKLRAIVILPTRELAKQVKDVFDQYAPATAAKTSVGHIQVGLASGAASLGKEQASIVQNADGVLQSSIDVLVTTPGRLMEHLGSTPGFGVWDLKFLVVDEADRLLASDFNQWMAPLWQAIDDAVTACIPLAC